MFAHQVMAFSMKLLFPEVWDYVTMLVFKTLLPLILSKESLKRSTSECAFVGPETNCGLSDGLLAAPGTAVGFS